MTFRTIGEEEVGGSKDGIRDEDRVITRMKRERINLALVEVKILFPFNARYAMIVEDRGIPTPAVE
jgi:hypothetical protein